MSDEQPQLFAPPSVPPHRVEALANVLAGMRWPDRGGFEKLKQGQKTAARSAARTALETLAQTPD